MEPKKRGLFGGSNSAHKVFKKQLRALSAEQNKFERQLALLKLDVKAGSLKTVVAEMRATNAILTTMAIALTAIEARMDQRALLEKATEDIKRNNEAIAEAQRDHPKEEERSA